MKANTIHHWKKLGRSCPWGALGDAGDRWMAGYHALVSWRPVESHRHWHWVHSCQSDAAGPHLGHQEVQEFFLAEFWHVLSQDYDNWIAIGYTGIIFRTLGLDFDFDQNSDLCTAGFRLAFMGISGLSLRFSATCPLTRQADSFVLRRGRLGDLWVIYRSIYNPKQGADLFTTIEQDVVLFDSDFFGVAAKRDVS